MSKSWSAEDDALLRQLVSQYDKQWNIISTYFPNKTPSQVSSRWEKYLDPNLIKGAFTKEEDDLIRQFVSVHGPRSWQHVTEYVPMRSAKQCRERWFNHLDPSVVNDDWTPEEDQVIFEKHQEIGPKWSIISRLLPGRTDNAIKNRWNASISKRVQVDSNGTAVLLPDTSKRKRRVAKQLQSRPAPLQTSFNQAPKFPVQQNEFFSDAQDFNPSEQPESMLNKDVLWMSEDEKPIFFPSKISPNFTFTPLDSVGGLSPNQAFNPIFRSPSQDFSFDF